MIKISKDQEEHALALHKKSLVVDFHCDAVGATIPYPRIAFGGIQSFDGGIKRTLDERSTEGHIDIPRLIEGGIDCQVFSHWVEPIYNPIAPWRMLEVMGYSLPEIEKNSDKIELVTKVDEIYKNQGKKISIIMGIEGGESLGQNLGILNIFYRLGLRRMTLTWSNRNALADGVRAQSSKGGLTEFGVSVVEECNNLGILVDVSHITDSGFWDVLETSKDPIIASHSNCRALCSSMRNLTDEMIKAITEKDGIIGVNYVSFYLKDRDKVLNGKPPTVETVVDLIDHMVDIIGGTDNLGLGSDFDGVPMMAKGLEDTSKVPNLTKALVVRGYSDQDIEKILGGNFLRAIKRVWK